MIRSILFKTKRITIFLIIVLPAAICSAFGPGMGEQEWLAWGNKCLNETYDAPTDTKLKKWEIELTPEHFIHLRKTYQHGKEEYFSLHLRKLDSINFVATSPAGGVLKLKTTADDVIVQTYDDPKGNIDSMATVLELPVKDMTPEKLDSLNAAIRFLKDKGL